MNVSLRLRQNRDIIQVSDTKIHLKSGQTYDFDHVFFGQNSQLYDSFCKPIVKKVLSGKNQTILVYGHSTSGKRYTLFGSKEDEGLIYRSIEEVLQINENVTINYF